jgi:hypothetical protein
MRTVWIVTALALVLTAPTCSAADQTAVLWQPPGNITIQDWIWGSGGQARAPKPPFEFVEEDLKGTNAKIRVSDAKGDHWTVKFGGENHSDVLASRLLFATGYVTEPSYFVGTGVISGAHDLRRAKPFLSKSGGFNYARFKLRDHKSLKHVDDKTWSWTDNPFVGKQELSGLKVLLMLMSNWDAKDARDGEGSNTAVFSKQGSASLFYAFTDWGATMGKWGGFFERDKWNPAGYREQTKYFVRAAPDGKIAWGYRGKHGDDVTSGISAADISWLLTYLSPVSDADLRAGLRASGAREPEVAIYTSAIRERITQLQRVAGSDARGVTSTLRTPQQSLSH